MRTSLVGVVSLLRASGYRKRGIDYTHAQFNSRTHHENITERGASAIVRLITFELRAT